MPRVIYPLGTWSGSTRRNRWKKGAWNSDSFADTPDTLYSYLPPTVLARDYHPGLFIKRTAEPW